jgi:hypothetical protein
MSVKIKKLNFSFGNGLLPNKVTLNPAQHQQQQQQFLNHHNLQFNYQNPSFLVGNSSSNLQNMPSHLRRSSTIDSGVDPTKYFNKYRILLGSNKKIKQISLTKCAKCSNPALRPFLTCTCSNSSSQKKATTSNKTVRFERTTPARSPDEVDEQNVTVTTHELPTNGIYDPELGLKKCSHSIVSDDFNKSLLSIIVKKRLNGELNMEEIDDMIKSQKIVTENWATPFENEQVMLPLIDNRSPLPSHRTESPPPSHRGQVSRRNSAVSRTTNNTDNESSMSHTSNSFLHKRRITRVELNISPISARDEYSFDNLKDLESMVFTRNEPAKLKLSQTPVPKTSNPYMAQVDRYDIHEKYKLAAQALSPDIKMILERNKVILDRVNREQAKSASAQRFLSMKQVSLSSTISSKPNYNTV